MNKIKMNRIKLLINLILKSFNIKWRTAMMNAGDMSNLVYHRTGCAMRFSAYTDGLEFYNKNIKFSLPPSVLDLDYDTFIDLIHTRIKNVNRPVVTSFEFEKLDDEDKNILKLRGVLIYNVPLPNKKWY